MFSCRKKTLVVDSSPYINMTHRNNSFSPRRPSMSRHSSFSPTRSRALSQTPSEVGRRDLSKEGSVGLPRTLFQKPSRRDYSFCSESEEEEEEIFSDARCML